MARGSGSACIESVAIDGANALATNVNVRQGATRTPRYKICELKTALLFLRERLMGAAGAVFCSECGSTHSHAQNNFED